jgi:hypothetical protein
MEKYAYIPTLTPQVSLPSNIGKFVQDILSGQPTGTLYLPLQFKFEWGNLNVTAGPQIPLTLDDKEWRSIPWGGSGELKMQPAPYKPMYPPLPWYDGEGKRY